MDDKGTTVGIDLRSTTTGNWGISLDGPNQDHMRNRLSNIAESTRNKIFRTAAKILGQCPPPTVKSGKVTGLALGKVQSGKTSSFITLAAQAFDNGYKVVVVLAGTKINLLKQNTERIQQELWDDRRMKLTVLTTERVDNTLSQDDLLQLVNLDRPVIITVLKHPKHIRQVAQAFRHPDLGKIPVLVIDDEGDQASLGTKPRKAKNGELSTTAQRRATNAAILELRETLHLHAYIAYTATPQANLLISTLHELSPEFCELVEPGPDYTGGSTFHGEDEDLYVREIPTSDTAESESEENLLESLEFALATFLVGAAMRAHNKDLDHHSMLVHTSHRKEDHGSVHSQVQALVSSWTSCMNLPDRDAAKSAVLRQLHQGYTDLLTTVNDAPSWDDVVKNLPDALKNCKVWTVNSSAQGKIPDSKNIHLRNNIFIGGNLLDRGVTVPGLAVTYITRWAKENQADTVEQRARWFGYKRKYLGFCRIFAPRPVLDGFAALLGHEDDLWESLRLWKETNQSIMEWPRLLRLDDPSLKPTRSSVANFYEVNKTDWIKQTKPAADPADAAFNIKVVEEFFDRLGATEESFKSQIHRISRKVNREIIHSQLFDRLKQVEGQFKGATLRTRLNLIGREIELNDMDVIWIQHDMAGEVRQRTIQPDGTVTRLLQGRNNNYEGDRQLLINTAHVQVHTPCLRDPDKVKLHQAVLLVIHTPGAALSEIRLVGGDNV